MNLKFQLRKIVSKVKLLGLFIKFITFFPKQTHKDKYID